MTLALTAQSTITGDAQSALSEAEMFLRSRSNAWIVSVFIDATLWAARAVVCLWIGLAGIGVL